MGGIRCSTNVYLIASFHVALSRLDRVCERSRGIADQPSWLTSFDCRDVVSLGKVFRGSHMDSSSHRYGERRDGLDTMYAVVGNELACCTGLLVNSPILHGR